MSFFDNLKRQAAQAVSQTVQKAASVTGNQSYTVSFQQLPVNLAQLQAMPEGALQKPEHTAAVVIVTVGEDGKVRGFQIDAQLCGIVRKGPGLARIKEEPAAVRLHKEAQAVLGGQIGRKGGIFHECCDFHMASF